MTLLKLVAWLALAFVLSYFLAWGIWGLGVWLL